jgi:ABC-2 type transport system permease protein
MDALRQILFRDPGFFRLEWNVGILLVLAMLYLVAAWRMLKFLERKAKEDGKITVKWQ